MEQSNKFTLNGADGRRWVQNTLVFSAPAILTMLVALQTGGDLKVALYMGYQAILAAAIDLVKKFIAGT